MSQRDSRNHHANLRRRIEKAHSARAQHNDIMAERAPLAGYETLYDVSRAGRVFPRGGRAVLIGGYQKSAFVRITVDGKVITLDKQRAIAESFAKLDATRSEDAQAEDT